MKTADFLSVEKLINSQTKTIIWQQLHSSSSPFSVAFCAANVAHKFGIKKLPYSATRNAALHSRSL
jgi:hypothetical protein